MSEFKSFLKQQLSREQPPIYILIRLFSVPLSWQIARLTISPHVLTTLGLFAAICAAIIMASGNPDMMLGSAALILLAYVFDCMDGEVARCRGVSSSLGSQLDQFSNWITLIALQIAMAMAAFYMTSDPQMLIWGIFSVAGWCTFYYLYIQMVLWVPQDGKFSLLRRLSRLLFILMPLDENLVILFAIVGRPDIGIVVSSIIGVILPIIVMTLYILYMSKYKPELEESAKTQT